MRVEAVLLDMDGVLFEGDNFWLELHEQYGTRDEGVDLASRWLRSDYDTLAREVLGRLWKGKPASPYWQQIRQRRYQPGVRELFDFIHHKNLKSGIVSSGPYDLAARAQEELGIDEIRANRLIIEADRISERIEIMVPDSEKKRVGLDLIERMGTTPAHTAFIGDSEADVPLAQIAGLPIAYNSHCEALNRCSAFVLDYGELGRCADIMSEVTGGCD
jgi:phosphoserine phosphatase